MMLCPFLISGWALALADHGADLGLGEALRLPAFIHGLRIAAGAALRLGLWVLLLFGGA